MAMDLKKFAGQQLEYVNPALFEVEFLSDKLAPEESERLKFACHSVEFISIADSMIVRLSFYNDEDGLVEKALNSALSARSPFAVFSFYKDGSMRRSEKFPEMVMAAAKTTLAWKDTDKVGSIEIEYNPIRVDKIDGALYTRNALVEDDK